jgi:hypothetical protein
MYLSKSTIQNYDYTRETCTCHRKWDAAGQASRHFNLFRPQIRVEEPFSSLTILKTYISCARYTISTEVP